MGTFILITAYILILYCLIKELKAAVHAKQYLKGLLALIAFHALMIYLNIGAPLVLLYGPIIYFYYKASTQANFKYQFRLLHLVPFVTFSAFYVILYYGLLISASWSGKWFIYYPVYFITMIVSLLGYALLITAKRKNTPCLLDQDESLVIQLSTANVINALFIGLLALKILNIYEDRSFQPHFLIYGLLFFVALLLFNYLMRLKSFKGVPVENRIENLPEQAERPRYIKSFLSEELFNDYDLKISRFLASSKVYLQPDVSIEDLAQALGITKHHFSQYLNVYKGKSFYQFIAEHRIAYAINHLKNEPNITVESLAYECGFNSKASFNRYFKEIVGCTPSAYRHELFPPLVNA